MLNKFRCFIYSPQKNFNDSVVGVFHWSRGDDNEETTKDSVYEIYSLEDHEPFVKVNLLLSIHNFNMIIYLVSKSIALYTTHVSGMIYHANSHFQITTVIVPRVRDDELQISNVLGL